MVTHWPNSATQRHNVVSLPDISEMQRGHHSGLYGAGRVCVPLPPKKGGGFPICRVFFPTGKS